MQNLDQLAETQPEALNRQLRVWLELDITKALLEELRVKSQGAISDFMGKELTDLGSVLNREQSIGDARALLSLEKRVNYLLEQTKTKEENNG